MAEGRGVGAVISRTSRNIDGSAGQDGDAARREIGVITRHRLAGLGVKPVPHCLFRCETKLQHKMERRFAGDRTRYMVDRQDLNGQNFLQQRPMHGLEMAIELGRIQRFAEQHQNLDGRRRHSRRMFLEHDPIGSVPRLSPGHPAFDRIRVFDHSMHRRKMDEFLNLPELFVGNIALDLHLGGDFRHSGGMGFRPLDLEQDAGVDVGMDVDFETLQVDSANDISHLFSPSNVPRFMPIGPKTVALPRKSSGQLFVTLDPLRLRLKTEPGSKKLKSATPPPMSFKRCPCFF